MRNRNKTEKGASSIELVLYTPILFLMIFTIIQFALTWHANQIASSVAREVARVARADGGGAAQAEAHGYQYAQQIGDGALIVDNIKVAPVGGDEIQATVTGHGIEIVDGLAPSVDKTVRGPIEEFRPDQ